MWFKRKIKVNAYITSILEDFCDEGNLKLQMSSVSISPAIAWHSLMSLEEIGGWNPSRWKGSVDIIEIGHDLLEGDTVCNFSYVKDRKCPSR